eukprot:scaffold104168_cov39-Phaeocystis_antarctica.AAC.1
MRVCRPPYATAAWRHPAGRRRSDVAPRCPPPATSAGRAAVGLRPLARPRLVRVRVRVRVWVRVRVRARARVR